MVKVREVTFWVDFSKAQIKDLASKELRPGGGWNRMEIGDSGLHMTLVQWLREGKEETKERVSKEKFAEISWSVNWKDEDFGTAVGASAKS